MEKFGLEEVIGELKQRGVRAGEEEARAIVAEARREAKKLRDDAEAQAAEIRARALEDKARTLAALQAELAQASRVGLMAFRQAVEQCLLVPVIDETLAELLSKPELLAELVLEMVRGFVASGMEVSDLQVLLPASSQRALEGAFLQKLRARGAQGIQVAFDPGLRFGLRISPKEQGFELDLSEEGFREIFLRFLSPRFRKAFFQEPGGQGSGGEPRSGRHQGRGPQQESKRLA